MKILSAGIVREIVFDDEEEKAKYLESLKKCGKEGKTTLSSPLTTANLNLRTTKNCILILSISNRTANTNCVKSFRNGMDNENKLRKGDDCIMKITNIIKVMNIILVITVMFTSSLLAECSTCHAENVIIIRRENKKGQGADIEIRPNRKRGKIEIRTRI